MPGIAQKISNSSDDCEESSTNYQNPLVGNGTQPCTSFKGSYISSNGFWSKHRDDVSYKQLQKFWTELTPQARKKLLRVDKQTLFEHARKNMYCSRCNGLLLEGFLQIVMYVKSLQQDAAECHYGGGDTNNQNYGDFCTTNGCHGDVLDPSVHPWGGLSTSRDGALTLLDCYLYSKSLEGLQKVFDSARARERERKLLYPDACGGGGRGWISQCITGYSRGHGTRETCALHTARLSVETLIDFWSALGEETRQSLLRMKEEDFIERLMYRFESKRFCRDCRRNVIREFKELKELKRMRREPRCTSWFCVADTAFQYEVSDDTVEADWHQTFLDALGTYHHFEWAIGTGEGKSDILEFENVGLSGKVQVSGLDLSALHACYITLRAWKMDGRCSELCVKAHAMRGQQCVHCRLVVGDGYVTITRGESIRSFFEHAEETEEEEDDESVDKDGNEFDGECSRPQKHAKSPELAREFLLDAATVIFKEQVEKAFREGTARQNAHSIFVCLALKLLEERVHVACKEIITLEKQMKLLEEEEKEKREEEERKERRRTKEREKKLRRKERLREKEKKCADTNIDCVVPDISEELQPCVDEGANVERSGDSVSKTGEAIPVSPLFTDNQDEQLLMEYFYPNMKNHFEHTPDGKSGNSVDWESPFPYDHIKYSRRKLKIHKDTQQDLTPKWSERRKGAALSENKVVSRKYEPRFHADAFESSSSINVFNKHLRTNAAKSNTRNGCSKTNEKSQCASNRIDDKCDSHVCNHHNECRSRAASHIMKAVRDSKYRFESPSDISKSYYRGKYTQAYDTNGRDKSNIKACNSPITKKVWEPLDSLKRYAQSNSDSDVALRPTATVETSGAAGSDEVIDTSVQTNNEANDLRDLTSSSTENCRERENGFHSMAASQKLSEAVAAEDGELCAMERSPERKVDSSVSSLSNSDNCSSCTSEGDSSTSSSDPQNPDSASASDSEESSRDFEVTETSDCLGSRITECRGVAEDQITTRSQEVKSRGPASGGTNLLGSLSTEAAKNCAKGVANISTSAQPQNVLAQIHNQNIHYPVVQAPTVGYYHRSPVSWPAGPNNALMSFPYSNRYLFANSYGYDLNCNAQFMQYGALQHLAPPFLNPVHVPVIPPMAQANGVSSKEHANNVNLCALKQAHQSIQNASSTEQHSAETPKVVNAGESGKINEADNGFSLFHFGGPVALSREGTVGNSSVNLSGNSPDSNHPCSKKDPVEEYNLFAASNGINFSIY